MVEEKKNTYLTGRLLLAMPGIGDPRFQRAVIMVCAHDKEGAMGLVINHILPGLDLSQLLKHMGIDAHEEKTPAPVLPIMSGGPVETARGFILHSSGFAQPDTIKINDRISVTGTIDALKAIAEGKGPNPMLFVLGYAGWGQGQLDEELRQNAWLVSEADPELVFSESPEAMWERAVRALGIDPAMLSGTAGRA